MSNFVPINRREFLEKSAAAVAAGAVLPHTALSYSRILGANDRISLAHVGIGNRGRDLDLIASKLKSSHNVEMTVVCDLWTVNREKAAATNAGYHGRAPRAVQHVEEVLGMKDVDGVLISTPEHSHSPILKMIAEAGKDAYIEKPMGNVLAEAKGARDAVLQAKTIVQVGTQHRSGNLWLVPVVVTKTSVTVSAIRSASTVPPEARSVVAIARADHNAEGNRRRGIKDRARRWCVIVSRCRRAVRLNDFGAGIRAQSRHKPEYEDRQCYHNNFFSHDRIFLLLFSRLNPGIAAKLPGESVPRPCTPPAARHGG